MSLMSGPEDLKRNRPDFSLQEKVSWGKRPSESKGLHNRMHRALRAPNHVTETKDTFHPGIEV